MGVFFFQAEDGIRDGRVTGVQTCALPICACETCGCWARSVCSSCTSRSIWRRWCRDWWTRGRSEERRVGKSVDRGGGGGINKKKDRWVEVGGSVCSIVTYRVSSSDTICLH